jgi:hypothetical protein
MRRGGAAVLFLAWCGAASAAEEPVKVCAQAGEDCTHISIGRALRLATDGQTILLKPGTYGEAGTLSASNITIMATGAKLEDRAAQGKAALVITGHDTVIVGLECTNIEVPDGNGACIRQEGRNLTLKRVNFHRNQSGLMAMEGSGVVRVEDSVFAENGYRGRPSILAQGEAFELVRSQVLRGRGEGHEITTTAKRTLIEDSIVASMDAVDSRLIDAPLGGEIVIRNSVLQKGRKNANPDVIGFAFASPPHPNSALTLENSTIVVDSPKGVRIVHAPQGAKISLSRNVVIGGQDKLGGDTRWFQDRKAANYPAYPKLGKTAAN